MTRNNLPEFLTSQTVGALIAAALDTQARQEIEELEGNQRPIDPVAQAQADIYRHAADEIRKHVGLSGGA